MKRILIFIFTLFLIIASSSLVQAHPGRTDDNGCHYCWTNCEYYGLSYGEYHCHDGNSSGSSSGTSSGTYNSPNISEETTETPTSTNTSNKTNSSSNSSSNSTSQYVRKKYYIFDIDISYFVYNVKSILREDLFVPFIIAIAVIIILIIIHYRRKLNSLKSNYNLQIQNLQKEIYKLYPYKNAMEKIEEKKKQEEKEIEEIKKYYRKNRKVIFGKNNPYTKKPIFTENDYVEYRLAYKKLHNEDLF